MQTIFPLTNPLPWRWLSVPAWLGPSDGLHALHLLMLLQLRRPFLHLRNASSVLARTCALTPLPLAGSVLSSHGWLFVSRRGTLIASFHFLDHTPFQSCKWPITFFVATLFISCPVDATPASGVPLPRMASVPCYWAAQASAVPWNALLRGSSCRCRCLGGASRCLERTPFLPSQLINSTRTLWWTSSSEWLVRCGF